jgi:phage terminase large subunit
MIRLPHRFEFRPYQLDFAKAFFSDQYDRFCLVWHRRAGKDRTAWNICVAHAQEKVINIGYMLPTLSQAKKVIWHGLDKEGISFLDQIPSELIASVNNSEMRVTFRNGSSIQCLGADRYDAVVGTGFGCFVFSEFSIQSPSAWSYFEPILVENKGKAIFIYTSRGHNHGYQLYMNNQKTPNWYTSLLTVEDTKDHLGNRYITDEDITKIEQGGMSKQMIQQEFYCSFASAMVGAYFGDQLDTAYAQNRILDYPIDNQYMVNTYWDLGQRHATAIWLIQITRDAYYVIGHYESNHQGLQHYIEWLQDFAKKYQIIYGKHYAPHDGAYHKGMSGKSAQDLARELGLNFIIVPRIQRKYDAIEWGRTTLSKCIFHATNCEQGLEALKQYHSEWVDKHGRFAEKPCDDWSADSADAFLQFAQSWHMPGTDPRGGGAIQNRVNQGKMFNTGGEQHGDFS